MNLEPKAIIGKGGFSKQATEILAKYNCIYLSYTGGTSALAKVCIKKVKNIYWPNLGMAEAVWEIELKDLPCLVTIAKNKNLYVEVKEKAEKIWKFAFGR